MLTQLRGQACRAAVSGSAWAAIVIAIAGCTPAPKRIPAADIPPIRAVVPVAIPADVQRFEIDPGRTLVTVIVRRAGPLARLGHDHVVTSAAESGMAWLGATPSASGFDLQLPVERFEVDQPEVRAAAGPEFSVSVPAAARTGTRDNMLRPEVLDAARHPVVRIHALSASGPWPNPLVRIGIVVRGVEHTMEVPVVIERSAEEFIARGTLEVRQSEFGMKPFAVAGGAIQVADVLEIRFEIAATARD